MSAIRPDLPVVLPGSAGRGAVSGQAADVRAAFFRAALDQVQATPPAIVATPTRRAESHGATASSADATEPGRSMRPGSLLDIRV